VNSTTDRPADRALPAFEPPPPAGDHAQALAAGGIVMVCDVPPEDARELPLPAPIRVLGWAYSRAGIDKVEVFVDGAPVRARYGLERGDVADALGERAALRCGFSVQVAAEPGPHELVVVATSGERAVGVRATIVAEPPGADAEPPEGEDSELSVDNEGERYVPEVHRGTYTEAEHQARYGWGAPLAMGRDVLDAGCGVGWGSGLLAQAGARRVVGIDIDEPALANARERAGASAEFVHGDLLALPFDDDSFDLVVCFEAIEHVDDPGRALDELRRVLRSDGLLVISSPNKGVYPAGNPHHVHELTSAELEATLRERFANVAIHRQQTHLGSLLSDDAAYAISDPVADVPARLHKLGPGEPGRELYTIGIAGDGALPTMENVAVLSAPFDSRPLHERIATLEQELLGAAARLAARSGELRQARDEAEQLAGRVGEAERARADAERDRDSAERSLEGLQSSASWRMTAPLRAAKRAASDARDRGSR
jgi:SAM-dependent methyltransferase